MALTIYKPGQGYWTRMMSAIALGLLVLMGGNWLQAQFANVRIGGAEPIYTRAAIFTIIVLIFGVLGYWLIGTKPRVVDFMVATEAEMKKVNWSSKREIIGSTWVVIGFTVFIGILCFIFDFVFQNLFQWVGVLET